MIDKLIRECEELQKDTVYSLTDQLTGEQKKLDEEYKQCVGLITNCKFNSLVDEK